MSVIAALEALPTSGVTISALEALDFAVPGEWSNVTSFDAMISEIADVQNPNVIAQIRVRAMGLEPTGHYADALRVYQLVDSVDQLAAGAAVASKVSGFFGGMLDGFTPKPETTQCLDAGVKLVAELIAFGLINGMPSTDPDGLARFTGALADYGRYDLMRIAAWVVYDGLIPLGPDFLPKMINTFTEAANNDTLTNNAVFEKLAGRLPGDTASDKRDFMVKTMNSSGDWIGRFIQDRGLTQDKVMSNVGGALKMVASGGDYMAAAIDATTNFTAHTGTQTVARALAKRSYEQMKADAWDQWLSTQGGR